MNYKPQEGYTFVEGDKEVEVKPTFNLQMQSLLVFSEALGYELNSDLSFEDRGYTKGYERTDKNIVSFDTMVKYHNTNFHVGKGIFGHPKTMKEKSDLLGFNLLSMESAVESKLVKQVHLQLKKGKKHRLPDKSTDPEIQVISHMIKFA